jgi:hypothetical protein
MKRPVLAMALLMGVSAPSMADERPKSASFVKPSCAVIRYYVAKYSAAAAEAWARTAGATEPQIESARQCLTIRTAQGT